MGVSEYNQTTFDKAFNRAVNYLLKEGLLASQQALASEIDHLPQDLWAILKGKRGVTKSKRDYAIFVLVDKYGVSRRFLETNQGSILTKPLPLTDHEHPEFIVVQKRLEECEKEKQRLIKEVMKQEQLISTQQILIDQLKPKK